MAKAPAKKAKAEPKPEKSKGGRPPKYSPELLKVICDRMATGTPLAEVCRDEGMPDDDTVRNWMEREDVGAEVSRAIARAREAGEDAIVRDAMKEIDREPVLTPTQFGVKVDPGDVALRKLRFEGRFKLLSKWNPKRWGDKVQLADADGNKLPETRVSLTDAQLEALAAGVKRG